MGSHLNSSLKMTVYSIQRSTVPLKNELKMLLKGGLIRIQSINTSTHIFD